MNDPATQIEADIGSLQAQSKNIRQIYEDVKPVSTNVITGTNKAIALLRKKSPEAIAALAELKAETIEYEALQDKTTRAASIALVSIQDASVCFENAKLSDEVRQSLSTKINAAHGLLKATHFKFAAKVIGCAQLFYSAANLLSTESNIASSSFERALEGAVVAMKDAVETTTKSQSIAQAAKAMRAIIVAIQQNPSDVERLMAALTGMVVSLVKLALDISESMARSFLFLEVAELALAEETDNTKRLEAREALNKAKAAFADKMRRLEFVVDSALVLASLPEALAALRSKQT